MAGTLGTLLNAGGTDIADLLPGLALPRGLYSTPTFNPNSPLAGLVQKLISGGPVTGTPNPNPTPGSLTPAQAVPTGIASQPQPGAGATPSAPPAAAPSGPGTESLVGRILSAILGPGGGDANVPTPPPVGSATGAALAGFGQKMADAGIPPPPNANPAPMTPATVGGMPPTSGVTPPDASPNVSQFDLMTQQPQKPKQMPSQPQFRQTGQNEGKGSSAEYSAQVDKQNAVKRAQSALAAVKPPPNPTGVNPSTPGVVQPRSIDLNAMNDLVAQVLARRQQTQLPELSAFLQRRPMA